jgi:hypothetical protein
MIDGGKLSIILSALSPRMQEGATLALPGPNAATPPVW